MCRKIIALFSCFVICFSFLCPTASAEYVSDSFVYTTTPYDDFFLAMSYALGGEVPFISPALELLANLISPNEVCPGGEGARHSGKAIRLGTRDPSHGDSCPVICLCDWCGAEFSVFVSRDELADAIGEAYDDYVNDLPSGLDSTSSGTTAFGTLGVAFATTEEEKLLADEFWASVDLYNLAASAEIGEELLVSKYSINSSIYFVGLHKVHNSYFGFDMLTAEKPCSKNMSPYTSADFPLGTFCLFGSSSVTSSSSSICYYASNYKFVKSVFLNYSDAVSAYVTSPRDLFYLRPDTRIVPVFWEGSTAYPARFRWENLGFISASGEVSTYSGNCLCILLGGSYSCYVYPSYPAVVDVGDEYDSTTRVSSVTNIFNEYNTTNNYVDNSVVNYYIGTVDESNNVTNIYNTNIYNEDTLVFTEPVTGAQIQTTGWSYNYDTRSYDIDLESGTFTMSDTDIVRIVTTYGDEAVTITYYDSSNTAVATDEYAYVLVASEQCTLYGHTNTVETILEATCSSGGQYKNVCSVCGHEELFSMEPLGHTFNYTVLREPSCDAEGLALYTCSVCGNEYTESIAALAHSYQVKETVDATYDEDGNKLTSAYTVYACSVCGNEYTDYTGDGVITDDSGHWSWLKKWLMEFKEWLGDLIGGISVDGGDTIYNDYQNNIDISGDTNHDYDITYEDENGEQQKTSIQDIINKFAFIEDLYVVGDTLITAVTEDAAVAYELDNTTSESDYSIMTDGVPTLTVNLGAAESRYGYSYGGQVTVLDLSWYAPYKETVDNLLSGFLWLMFLWRLFKSGPSILGGTSLTTEAAELYRDRRPALPKGGKKH